MRNDQLFNRLAQADPARDVNIPSSASAQELIARAELPPSGNISGRKLVITFAGAFDFQVGQSAT